MSEIKWEPYITTRTCLNITPVISIRGKGGFGFNKKFIDSLGFHPEFVALFYAQDPFFHYIGFDFLICKIKNSLKLNYLGHNKLQRGIRTICFFKLFNLVTSEIRGSYDFIKENDRFIIKIKKKEENQDE